MNANSGTGGSAAPGFQAMAIGHDAMATGQEDDSWVAVAITAFDPEDGDAIAPDFRLVDLPPHGRLQDFLGNDLAPGDILPADRYDPDLGAWVLEVYFVPDPDWSGSTSFGFRAIDSEGNESATAEATIAIAAQADAPIVDANVNDGADPDGAARNLTLSNGGEDGPVYAALDNGRMIAVWQAGFFPSRIVGQIFAVDGTPEGQIFSITPAGGVNEFMPVVAGKPDGSFAVAWVQDGAGTGGGDIVTAFFARGATSPSSVVTAIGSSGGIEQAPSIAALPGGWVVTGAYDSGGGVPAIGVQAYGADLTPGTFFTALTDVGNARVVPIGSGGDYVVVGTASDGMVYQAVVAGGVAGAPEAVNGAAGAGAVAAARLADGGWVVVWVHDNGSGNQDLWARIYDAAGASPAGPVRLTNTPFSSEFAPEVAALPDGRFVVAWIGNDGVDFSQDVFARLFDGDGSPVGQVLAVTETGTAAAFPNLPIEEVQPTLTVLSDGRFSVGWLQVRATGGNNPDVFLRTYAPTPSVLEGFAGIPLILPTTVTLADRDGSELLSRIIVRGLPEGFTLPHGARFGGDPDGDWIIDRSTPEGAAFLDGLAAGSLSLVVTAPLGYSGTPTLEIMAQAMEPGDSPSFYPSAFHPVPLSIAETLFLDLNGAAAGLDAAAAFVEGDAAILLAPDAVVAGGTDGDLAGGILTIAWAANREAADVLGVAWQGGGAGEISLSGNVVSHGAATLGILAVGADGSLALALDAAATMAGVEAFLRRLVYANASEAPSTAPRSIAVTLEDASAEVVHQAVVTVAVNGMDDAAEAAADVFATAENAVVSGNLFADNGSGADRDVDGPSLTVAAVNGVSANVGAAITLASGARLTVNADGSYSYDPNGAFGWLISSATAALTGAVNTAAADSFSYTLAGGGTATVTVTVSGVHSADDRLHGDSGGDHIAGTPGADLFVLHQGGSDEAHGGAGHDRFYFGGTFDAGDRIDGGAGDDALILGGLYDYVFGETQLTGIERLRLLPVGGIGDPKYTLVMADGNVAAGAQLRVDATDLPLNEGLIFVGMHETDGSFLVYGGSGRDTLAGGARGDRLFGGGGDDTLYGLPGNDLLHGGMGPDFLNGGSGADVFLFESAAESTGLGFDVIEKFEPLRDTLDLPFDVAGWTGHARTGELTEESFDADIAAALDDLLQPYSAALFSPDSGFLAGRTYCVIDVDGDGAYQAGQDYLIEFWLPVGRIDWIDCFV